MLVRSLFLLFGSTLLCLSPAFSQAPPMQTPQGVIAGVVIDGQTGEPIESAAVAVWRSADSTLVTGAVTLRNGQFTIENVRPGRYYLRISFLGYQTLNLPDVTIAPNNLRADVGRVRLSESTRALDEVEVTADRELVEVGIDRTSYNVRDNPIAASGSVSELLATIPSVEVDANGTVSLRGNQNVAILVNGRPAPVSGQFLAAFLQQIPAGNIERIEVIPNPSARYEPDGMSGIINIVLRQDRSLGLNGGIVLGGGSGPTANASGNLAYQGGKWNLSSNYGFRLNERPQSGFTLRENRFLDPVTFLRQTDGGFNSNNSHVFNNSVDYRFNRTDEINTSAMFSFRDGLGESENLYAEMNALREPQRYFARLAERESDGLSSDVRVGFRRIRQMSKHEFTAEARVNVSSNDGFNAFRQEQRGATGLETDLLPIRENDFQTSRNTNVSAQVDYMRPVGENSRFEVGARSGRRALDNAIGYERFDYGQNRFVERAGRSNEFEYIEDVHAAYLQAGHTLGKMQAQFGLRGELATTDFNLTTTGDVFTNTYRSLFPSAFVTYAPVLGTQFRASYSRRINRPNTWFLNPFVSSDDPLNVRVGNPMLRPEYTDAFELGFTQMHTKGMLTVSPFYRITNDVIRRYVAFDQQTGVTTATFANLATSSSYGSDFILAYRPNQGFNAMLSANVFKMVTDGSNVESGLSNEAIGWGLRGNFSYTMRPGLDVTAFFFYRAPMQTEQGRVFSFRSSDITVRQRLLDNRASLALRVSDVFDTMGFRFESSSFGMFQEGERRFMGGRQGILTFTYNFGEQSNQQRRQRRPQGEQEQPMMDPEFF
jgi:outer membrane receptor protein involved in Fe transport